jgi:hypothetical protein
MDQATLVEYQIDDGRKIAQQLRAQGIDVTAVFWLKTSEDDQWYLYIGTRAVDDLGLALAYRKVFSAVTPLRDLWVSRSQIKLIGATNPITRDVLSIRDQHASRTIPTRVGTTQLGSVHVEEAYVYPPSAA